MECSGGGGGGSGFDAGTYYGVLGVRCTAGAHQIRSAFLKLARRCHPDKHRNSWDAKRRFQAISEAYEVLSDPRRRRQYDLGLVEQFDIEEYLTRFQELTLTASGLGIGLQPAAPLSGWPEGRQHWLTA